MLVAAKAVAAAQILLLAALVGIEVAARVASAAGLAVTSAVAVAAVVVAIVAVTGSAGVATVTPIVVLATPAVRTAVMLAQSKIGKQPPAVAAAAAVVLLLLRCVHLWLLVRLYICLQIRQASCG